MMGSESRGGNFSHDQNSEKGSRELRKLPVDFLVTVYPSRGRNVSPKQLDRLLKICVVGLNFHGSPAQNLSEGVDLNRFNSNIVYRKIFDLEFDFAMSLKLFCEYIRGHYLNEPDN
jgi:hypothetical protein